LTCSRSTRCVDFEAHCIGGKRKGLFILVAWQ
jgi:hypothetical protein